MISLFLEFPENEYQRKIFKTEKEIKTKIMREKKVLKRRLFSFFVMQRTHDENEKEVH